MSDFSGSTFSAHAWAATSRSMTPSAPCRLTTRWPTARSRWSAFRHYMVQDAHYLIAFGRGLAIARRQGGRSRWSRAVRRGAKVAVVVERSLHADFFQSFGISPDDFARTEMSPVCHHYTSFLIGTAHAEPYPVVLAALLPCFWIYAEIGPRPFSAAPCVRTPMTPGSTPMPARSSTWRCAR